MPLLHLHQQNLDEAAPLGWLPSYPEPQPKRGLVVAAAMFFAAPIGPPPTVEWQGEQPAMVQKAILPVACIAQSLAFVPPSVDLPWLGDIPDVIRVKGPRSEHVQVTAFVPPLVTLEWQASFPDIIDRKSFLAAEQQVLALAPPVVHLDLPWQPLYPDFVIRSEFLVALQPFSPAQPFPPTPSPAPTPPPKTIFGGGGFDPRPDYDLDDIIAERNAWAYREAIENAPITLAPLVVVVSNIKVTTRISQISVRASVAALDVRTIVTLFDVSATLSTLDVKDGEDV